MRLALALGGGAGLGWAHIGVLRALAARHVAIDAVAGTSIGAIAAVCLAGGRLDMLEELARATNLRAVMGYLDTGWFKGAVLGGKPVARRLHEHFGDATLDELSIPTAVVAADIMTGEEVVLTTGPVIDAVRASIAIPGIFPPVRLGNRLLVDGGVVTPVPVAAVRALSDCPVLAVNLQGDYRVRAGINLPPEKRLVSPLRSGRAGLSLVLARLAELGLAAAPGDVTIAPCVGHIEVQDFTRARELIECGFAAVEAAWPRIAAAAQKRATVAALPAE